MTSTLLQATEIWISAEHWAPGEWNPPDDIVDVIVTLSDGMRWTATMCSFAHVATLRAHWATTGECLGGRYVWAMSLVLVEDTSRACVEAVVRDLLATGELPGAFTRCSPVESSEVAG